MRPVTALGVALLAAGCWRHSSAAPLPSRGPARDSLLQLDLARGDSIVARGPVDGALALLRADVVYLRSGIPAIFGREAVRALLSSARPPLVSGAGHLWQPLGAELSADHQSAYTYGIAATATPQTPPAIRADRYIAFWQREARQPWRIVAYSEVGGPPVDLAFPAEQTTPPPPLALAGRMAEVIMTLRSADSAFSDLADRLGVADAFSAYVDDQGAVFAGPELIVGPKAIHEFYDAQSAGTSLVWTPRYALSATSADLGFTVGTYVATGRGPSGAAVQRFGKYLTIWKRQSDGSWKFMIDGGSPNPAPSARGSGVKPGTGTIRGDS